MSIFIAKTQEIGHSDHDFSLRTAFCNRPRLDRLTSLHTCSVQIIKQLPKPETSVAAYRFLSDSFALCNTYGESPHRSASFFVSNLTPIAKKLRLPQKVFLHSNYDSNAGEEWSF